MKTLVNYLGIILLTTFLAATSLAQAIYSRNLQPVDSENVKCIFLWYFQVAYLFLQENTTERVKLIALFSGEED